MSRQYTKTYRRPWQWCHVRVQFCREIRQLKLCQVAQKITCEIVQHARNRGTHPRTQADTQGFRSWDWGVLPINGDIHQVRRGRTFGACQQRDHPVRKPLRQWLYASVWHPTILFELTPEIRLSRFRIYSATPSSQCRWRRTPRDHLRLPQGPPHGRRWSALPCLLWLVAPKYQYSPGWGYQWGW